MPHAGRVAATVSTDPVERRERLARANAARAKRDRGVGFTVICIGLTIFLIPCLVVVVLYWTGVATSEPDRPGPTARLVCVDVGDQARATHAGRCRRARARRG